jgi:imidazole glycerol-phosphate synthase subunit HisH
MSAVAIIDYGVGNLRSVENAFKSQEIEAVVSSDEKVLRAAERLVLPGVGAFAACMDGLKKRGFDQLVCEAAAEGKPVIGLCVGLQMLFDEGHEFGVHRGLGLLRGRVVKFDDGLRVPHVGWNQVSFRKDSPIFEGLAQESFFYFVHSYYVVPGDPEDVMGITDYGRSYASICGKGRLMGVQFHPEKSQTTGLRLLANFARL